MQESSICLFLLKSFRRHHGEGTSGYYLSRGQLAGTLDVRYCNFSVVRESDPNFNKKVAEIDTIHPQAEFVVSTRKVAGDKFPRFVKFQTIDFIRGFTNREDTCFEPHHGGKYVFSFGGVTRDPIVEVILTAYAQNDEPRILAVMKDQAADEEGSRNSRLKRKIRTGITMPVPTPPVSSLPKLPQVPTSRARSVSKDVFATLGEGEGVCLAVMRGDFDELVDDGLFFFRGRLVA